MIKFNNDGCVKCGATVFSRTVAFIKAAMTSDIPLSIRETGAVEWLQVRCDRCGYKYYMHCADHPEHGLQEVMERTLKHEEPVHGSEEESK
jgi:predicted nucleic-acid-binding Zn-ribbon protein